jgi:hypothetical protein
MDAIFFVHGGPKDDLPALFSEGTVCGTIVVVPGTCPGPFVIMNIRYCAWDPIRDVCDETAKRELLNDFAGWIYTEAPGCTVTGGNVIFGYRKDCPEVNWRIVCNVPCVRSDDDRVCGNSRGQIQIAPDVKKGSELTGPTEALVVQWSVDFADKCCVSAPCTSSIALLQTPGGLGRPRRPKIILPNLDIIDTPKNPPCPRNQF